ncbi:MAG: hypothetical protein M9894_34235 [Planctomycetes bacterium]|nr:hypothetical protein [Planctomycetota bacterium]
MADALSAHDDNTFSLLRGGVTEFTLPRSETGLELRAGVVVRIAGSAVDAGSHLFWLVLVDSKQQEVAAGVSGRFAFGVEGGVAQFASNVVIPLPGEGRYELVAKVDDRPVDRWPLTVTDERGGAE